MADHGTKGAEESTVAKYYQTLISDFDTNEKKIMDELDKLARQTQKGKKGGSMSDAAGGAEEIRGWKDHMWTKEKLEEEMDTKFETGLTAD